MTDVDAAIQKDEDDKRSTATTIVKGVRKNLFDKKQNVADEIASQSTVKPSQDMTSDIPSEATGTHLQRNTGMINYKDVKTHVDKDKVDSLTNELKSSNLNSIWSQVANILGEKKTEPPKGLKDPKAKAQKLAANIVYHDIKHLIKFDESEEEAPTEKEKQERQKQLDSMVVGSSGSSSSGTQKPKPKASNIKETDTGKRASTKTDDDIENERVQSIKGVKLPNPINTASMDFWKEQPPSTLRLQLAIRGVKFSDSVFEDTFYNKDGVPNKKQTKATVKIEEGKGKKFLLSEIKKLIDSKKWVV
jgi:hypothetical protein